MSRRGQGRPVRWVAHAFATLIALAVTATLIGLSFGLFAVRFVGLDAYVVQGGPTEPTLPIGSLVLVAPIASNAVRVGARSGRRSAGTGHRQTVGRDPDARLRGQLRGGVLAADLHRAHRVDPRRHRGARARAVYVDVAEARTGLTRTHCRGGRIRTAETFRSQTGRSNQAELHPVNAIIPVQV